MKKTLVFLSACLLASLAVEAKHDGWYVNTLTKNYQTDHLNWDMKSAPLKVLFYVQPTGARDVVELAQRMNLDYTPFIPSTRYQFASDSVYAAALTGTSPFEKGEELRAKAQKDFDVIFLGNVPFKQTPEDAQFQLLMKVKAGTGMIVHYTPIPYKKVFANPLERPAFLDEVVLPFPENQIKVYQFGKGRILQIRNPAWTTPAVTRTYGDSGIRARAVQENELVFLMRAMQWAAGKDVSIGKVTREGDLLTAPEGVGYRLRDEFNHVLKEGTVTGKISLAEYGSGRYFCDLIVPGKGCAVFAFDKTSALGNTKLALSSTYLRGKIPFKGEFSVEKPSEKDLTLNLSLVDHPNGRIWEKRSIKFPAGKKSISFEFKDYRMPNEAGALYAVLKDAEGKEIAKADETIYFPAGRLPVYYQTTFGNASSLNMAKQLVDNLGFGVMLGHMSYDGARNMALRNEQIISYLTRVTMGKGDDQGNVKLMFLTDKERKAAAAIKDQSFYNPQIQKLWKDQIVARMNGLPELSPVLYSLGDENVLTREAGFGASDLPAFRKFVEKKYGKIARLNENWGTDYKSFAEVPHRTLSESDRDKKYAEWNDHNEYMEQQFADIHHYSAKVIKELDPYGKVGLEGTFGGHDIELMMEHLDWWGPYTNTIEDQVLRSLYPEVPRFVWSGYHGERTIPAPLMDRYILLGSVNGNGWYAAACDFNQDILAVDQSPSFPKNFNDELQRLRFGMAQMLITNPMTDSGLGIWWSHVNRRSIKVDERCIAPESGIGAVIQFCNATGSGLEFVTSRTAEKRLKNYKVLLLMGTNAISDRDAERILKFVKDGGTVIADLTPGFLNENLMIRKNNPLAPLFGNVTLASAGKKYVVQKMEIPGLKAEKALVDPTRKFMEVVQYGKGRAILTTFNFALPGTSADPSTPFVPYLRNLLVSSGCRIPYEQSNTETVFRVRDGKNFKLIGLHNSKTGAKDTVTLPESGYIYECGKGYVDKGNAIHTTFAAEQPLRVYSVFRKEQSAPEVKMPASVNAGENLRIGFRNLPEGRTVVIRVTGPDGKDLPERGVVLNTNDGKEYLFGVPYNAPKGKYQFKVTDYVTGLSTTKTADVQ